MIDMMARAIFGRRRLSSAALLLLMTAAGHARQTPFTPWTPNYEEPFVSQIDGEMIEVLSEMLTLSAEQQAAVQHVWNDHRDRFQAFVTEARPVQREFDRATAGLKPTTARWMLLVLEYEERLAKIADEQADVDERFLEEVKLLLADEQLARWPEFEQWWVRERWARLGLIFLEEPIDLIVLVEELESPGLPTDHDEGLQGVLREYSARFAAALRERAQFEIEMCREFYRRDRDRYYVDIEKDISWEGPGKGNWRAEFDARRRRAGQVHRVVRDVNRSFMPIVQAALPAAARAEFARRYYERALLEVTRPSPLRAGSFMETVQALPELDEDQRAAIHAAAEAHHLRFLQRARTVIDAHNEAVDSRFEVRVRHERDARETALQAAVDHLYASERQAVAEVWSLLTAPQRQPLERPEIETPLVPR